ncbi:MAG: hypothetical protein HQ567_24930 [Candidatus Nealsonbacteria bacterium]|nr:hypothetical protein [Candidatus Nealsonbacteria bacterium]
MAKKNTSHQPPSDIEKSGDIEETVEIDETVEQSPKVRKAADAVERAKAELKKARGLYEQVREETVEKLKGAREKRVGELIDGTLDAVKKHPGLGVIVAACVGFFLGRIFRR